MNIFYFQNISAGQNIVIGDITYQTVRYSTNITNLVMSKSGTIYYYGENYTGGIVAPTTLRYEANTELYTYNTRLGTFIFVPD